MAAEPVVYGASERPPRGDYSRARPDYTCPQRYESYSDADHDTYRRLYERQAALVPGLACDEFIAALPALGARERIPRFEDINARLYQATRWEIVAVPGLIPEVPFFTLLANRKFPVTDWLRTPPSPDWTATATATSTTISPITRKPRRMAHPPACIIRDPRRGFPHPCQRNASDPPSLCQRVKSTHPKGRVGPPGVCSIF